MPTASSTNSGMAPARAATTGRPQAMASSRTSPNVSFVPACTSASADAIHSASSMLSRRYGSIVTFAGRTPVAVAADEQQVIRRAQPGERIEQHRQVLLAGEASRIHQHARRRREPEPLPQPVAASLRLEHLRVDAERLVHRVLHAQRR